MQFQTKLKLWDQQKWTRDVATYERYKKWLKAETETSLVSSPSIVEYIKTQMAKLEERWPGKLGGT